MEEKKTNKEKKKIEFDSFAILSIAVMVVSVGIAVYFLFSFGK
jgi:hypothetical protein